MGNKYSLGVDFGSLSARAALFDTETGVCAASFGSEYEHGILEERHPFTGVPLPPASALQMPEDYLKALKLSIAGVLEKSGIAKEDIIGMSVDFTSCSLVSLDKEYRPLCWQNRFRSSRNAYVKMWKQHTAVKEAKEITQKAGEMAARYGGKILSEWGIPKILETLREEPELYQATHRFMEAGDWIVYLLTGQESMSPCSAGFKFMWEPERGYPSREFFESLDKRMADMEEKLVPSERILRLDACAGYITEEGSRLSGLPQGIPVAPMRIDGHSAAVALGCERAGDMVLIMGTSLGMVMLDDKDVPFPGVCGVCYGSVHPDYYGYETGLSSCGDIFQWFADNCVPEECQKAARKKGISVLQELSERMSRQKPGESGLIALDWWNGNRSVLEDEMLSGMILGLTLQTRPEEILRALFEAVSFAVKLIIEEHKKNGVEVKRLLATGGIAEKNEVFVQIFADVIGCDVLVPEGEQICALGSAVYGAVAAGRAGGGFDTLSEAIEKMACKKVKRYVPNEDYNRIYRELFAQYRRLHDYFGRGQNDVMKYLLGRKKTITMRKSDELRQVL